MHSVAYIAQYDRASSWVCLTTVRPDSIVIWIPVRTL